MATKQQGSRMPGSVLRSDAVRCAPYYSPVQYLGCSQGCVLALQGAGSTEEGGEGAGVHGVGASPAQDSEPPTNATNSEEQSPKLGEVRF